MFSTEQSDAPYKDPGVPGSHPGRICLLGSLLLASTLAPAGPRILAADRNPAAAELALPSNLELTATLLRHRPKSNRPLSPDAFAQCRGIRDLITALAPPPPSKGARPKSQPKTPPASSELVILFSASRSLLLGPAGRAEFASVETRPAFRVSGDPSQGLTNQLYGLNLRVDCIPAFPADTGSARPRIQLRWAGVYAWSDQILSKWEHYAYLAYSAATKIPGATYEAQTEDDDGFLNPGGRIDVGGLFKRKKDKTPQPANTPAPATDEPSYSGDTARTELPFRGDCVVDLGRLAVFSIPADRADGSPQTFYLVFQPAAPD